MSEEYNKYSGKFQVNNNTDLIKGCHQIIKNTIIQIYSNNINLLIDIGSGRGHDYKAWVDNNIKNVIGLEPSERSIMSSIKKYKINSKKYEYPKIRYIRAVGNEIWTNGKAGLDDNNKNLLIQTFKNGNKADNIHMFWTIHYCMETKKEFLNLFNNINDNLKKGGLLIILSMNGQLIHKLLKKNNGSYKNITGNGDNIFQINSYYDHNNDILSPYGNIIGIKLAGTYGLDNEIKECLVSSKFLVKYFKKRNYELILKENFIKFGQNNDIECMKEFNIYQKRVSIFYDIIIFKKM